VDSDVLGVNVERPRVRIGTPIIVSAVIVFVCLSIYVMLPAMRGESSSYAWPWICVAVVAIAVATALIYVPTAVVVMRVMPNPWVGLLMLGILLVAIYVVIPYSIVLLWIPLRFVMLPMYSALLAVRCVTVGLRPGAGRLLLCQ
jgi:hypothetical protein